MSPSKTSKKPVVVYGASGYTGRLVCEYLREYNIPFIAAGRSAEKIHAAMKSNVAGIETADYEVVEVIHTAEALTELFRGASVVLNTVGPFATFGTEVVEACLAAKCHYTDTTGEQDWLIMLDEEYGARFAAAGLLLSPGLAQMYTTGEIAAQLCLETPGIDTLDIAVFWGGSPTVASTLTILVNAALSKAYYLEQNAYQEWDPEAGLYQLVIPGQHELALALPWGGTSHPVWFRRDPRVANCKVLGGVFNRPLMLGVPQIVGQAIEATKDMDPDERYAALTATAAQVMNQMPPRENPRINKSMDSVHASGPLGRAHCVIHGNSNYKQTGLL
jgi:NAD(P)-dependent dehydrogenase (short-subunit alcohol dehydrogenase family)